MKNTWSAGMFLAICMAGWIAVARSLRAVATGPASAPSQGKIITVAALPSHGRAGAVIEYYDDKPTGQPAAQERKRVGTSK